MRERVFLIATGALLLAGLAAAETTRTLTARIDASGSVAVENLAGAMTVSPGDDGAIVVVATVHAEDEALAAAVRLEKVSGENGVPTLRVVVPRGERRFRYPGHGSSEVKYDGRRVQVSGSGGVLLWAEVVVKVPGQQLEAAFVNHVGPLQASDLAGTIRLDAGSGAVTARRLSGTVTADTGSGAVAAEAVRGSLTADTGSGKVEVTGFEGSTLRCDTGSGSVRVASVKATSLQADTGSGRITITGADLEELVGDTGSGSIEAELVGSRLRRVTADTGSGSVSLKVPADLGFELHADQGSGDLDCGFADAQQIVEHREVVGCRRGNASARIDVSTGSGSVSIAPL